MLLAHSSGRLLPLQQQQQQRQAACPSLAVEAAGRACPAAAAAAAAAACSTSSSSSIVAPWQRQQQQQHGGRTATSCRGRVACRARRQKRSESVQDPTSGNADEDGKRAALDAAIRDLQLKHGKGSIMRLGDTKFDSIETFSSGSLVLDAALGGGIPRGRVVEIFGPESSGKTTVALHSIAEVQKLGEVACLVDAEHAFDPHYAKAMGVNTSNLILSQPDSGEEALDMMDELARSGAVSLVVMDSVSALVPKVELEGEIGAPGVGLQARLLSQGMRKLVGSAAKSKCTFIFINQLRYKVGVMYGNPETTSGGQSLKFYSSVRIDVRKRENLGSESSGSHVSGIKVRCKVVKNKVAPPFRECMIDILFDRGIDAMGGLLDAAEASGVVTRKGAYYYFKETRLGQGREKSLEFLRNSTELVKAIDAATRSSLKSRPDLFEVQLEELEEDMEGGEQDGAEGAEEALGEEEGSPAAL